MSDCDAIQNSLWDMGVYIGGSTSNCCNNPAYKLNCNQFNRVTEVYWDNFNLTGTFTLGYSDLQYVTKISIANNPNLKNLNALCDVNFKTLQWLDISKTKAAVNCLPQALGQLYARDAGLTVLPKQCSLPLRILDISKNQVQSLPCNWPLNRLYASNNLIDSTLNLCSSTMEIVDLSSNKLGNGILCKWNSAKYISLKNNNIKSTNNLCGIASLKSINLANNQIQSISNCNANLQEISIENNNVQNITDILCDSNQLQYLNAEGNYLSVMPNCFSSSKVEIYGTVNEIQYYQNSTIIQTFGLHTPDPIATTLVVTTLEGMIDQSPTPSPSPRATKLPNIENQSDAAIMGQLSLVIVFLFLFK
eukprot:NODE_442_length_7350_cov_0.498552.p3 type:complete len:362 gc:universal NODE_442_length_7350_cov_0.498552:357-1442(+)